jgi:hypothetical protein
MLENSISKLTELRSVKAQADQHHTQTGKSLTYQQYCQLLLSAAQQHDAQFEPTAPDHKSRSRQVYSHDITCPSYEAYTHDTDRGYDSHDIDSNVQDLIEVNQTSFVRGPRLRRNQWDRLALIPKAQETWDSLSAEAKKIILEPMPGGPPPPQQANLHDISAFDYIQAK